MTKRKVGKPVLGMDNLSDETSIPRDRYNYAEAVRELLNIDLDKDGNASRRGGFFAKITSTGFHSLYSTQRGWLMLSYKTHLGIYEPDEDNLTLLYDMGSNGLVSYTEAYGNLYGVTISGTCMFSRDSGTPKPIGVPLPPVPLSFEASENGGLHPGTYGVGFTIVDEDLEESGLSPITTVELPAGGGVTVTMVSVMPGKRYRVYMTTADGEKLYQTTEFDADGSVIYIGERREGREARTHGLVPLPHGYIIRSFGARLYVATENAVIYSDAFRPHLSRLEHNFLPTVGFVTMMEPVDTGIYVSDRRGVAFFKGDDPSDFTVKAISPEPAIFGTAISVPGEYLPTKYQITSSAAVWLSVSGFNLGLPTGEVVHLHKDQIKLPAYLQGCSVLALRDGRKQVITSVSNSTSEAHGIAIDSVTDL